MHVELILVPYDSGQERVRMGAGPEALAPAARQLLEARGNQVTLTTVELDGWAAEIAAAFQLAGKVALHVRAARTAGRFPLIFAGNCGVAPGACAGLDGSASVIWLDAHGDFNTPETTVGGFLDGMTLATLTGRCWRQLAANIPGFEPVPDERVWLAGARDLDPLEDAALGTSAVRRAAARDIGAALATGIAAALPPPHYLHVDLDVIDAAAARVNSYAAPGGVSPRALAGFCGALRTVAPPAAVTFSAYDPAADSDGRGRDAAMDVLAALF